jgi:hypothetical protein
VKRRKQLFSNLYEPAAVSKAFQDDLPQPTIPFPRSAQSLTSDSFPSPGGYRSASPTRGANTPSSAERVDFETVPNMFGLFRRYFCQHPPSHDPESEVDLSGLSNVRLLPEGQPRDSAFGPYPNESSFRLGEWYWNDSLQKSQASFKELVKIVGDNNFQPTDVRFTNWEKVNQKLAGEVDDQGEWWDEDAGWRTVPVKISVPFHHLTPNPGCRDFAVQFCYRPLVSVIQEKLRKKNHIPHFHFEPYELLWQKPAAQDPIRIHGELYTSPAFIDAHNALQNSPPEPGCDLPRVVVALMFWSDGTHLTQFGEAKLWPLYMFFGNESKHRRSRPSCHLCEHVAYFETACVRLSILRVRV